MRFSTISILLLLVVGCGDDAAAGGSGGTGGGGTGAAGGGGAAAGGAATGGTGQGGNPLEEGPWRRSDDCGEPGGFGCTPPGSFFCGGAVMCTFDPVCATDDECGDMEIC